MNGLNKNRTKLPGCVECVLMGPENGWVWYWSPNVPPGQNNAKEISCSFCNPHGWDTSGRSYEWVCKHGVGHPDMRFTNNGIHGCDGCCMQEHFPGNKNDTNRV